MDMEEPQVESMMYSRQAHEYMKRGRDLPWEVQRVQNWKFRRFFKGQFGNYDSALEIGSGLGDWSNLLPGNLDVTRSDMDSEILDLAREKYPRANYRQIDLSNIDLEDGSVEAVFGNSVLDCVHPLDRVVDELHRVLKPSGKVVHTNYYLPANPNIAKWLNENKDGYFTTVGLGSKIDTRMYIIRFESRERYEQFADQAFAFFLQLNKFLTGQL